MFSGGDYRVYLLGNPVSTDNYKLLWLAVQYFWLHFLKRFSLPDLVSSHWYSLKGIGCDSPSEVGEYSIPSLAFSLVSLLSSGASRSILMSCKLGSGVSWMWRGRIYPRSLFLAFSPVSLLSSSCCLWSHRTWQLQLFLPYPWWTLLLALTPLV